MSSSSLPPTLTQSRVLVIAFLASLLFLYFWCGLTIYYEGHLWMPYFSGQIGPLSGVLSLLCAFWLHLRFARLEMAAGCLTFPLALVCGLKLAVDTFTHSGLLLSGCRHNRLQIGYAVERYRTSHGRYPFGLSQLQPQYLQAAPTCPDSGQDTYTAFYQVNRTGTSYTVLCGGERGDALGTFGQDRVTTR